MMRTPRQCADRARDCQWGERRSTLWQRIERSLLALLLSLPLITCSYENEELKQTGPLQSDLKEIQTSIAQIGLKMQQAVLEGDFATQLSFLADDIIIDSPLEPPIKVTLPPSHVL